MGHDGLLVAGCAGMIRYFSVFINPEGIRPWKIRARAALVKPSGRVYRE
jgi:hypothetical protein